MKSEPNHEKVAMTKYGITREKKYVYHFKNYKYDSFAQALSEAMRVENSE